MDNNNNDVAISVDHVSKDFHLPHEKNTSIKSVFTGIFRKKDSTVEVQHALNDISFEIRKGEFFGIVGRNGSGKSTLLKIIAGIYQPTEGKVRHFGRLVPFIELGVGFNPELTGRENVFLNGALMGFSRSQVRAKLDEIIEFSELDRFMDQKLKNYSSGMQVRLAFSVATILADSDILLIDEVLAVGDAAFQKKCFAYFRKLKEENKTVIFVSHDMNAVKEYCDRAVFIEQSELIKSGSSSDVASTYDRMFNEEAATKDDLRKKKKRWGSRKVSFESVEATPDEVHSESTITISADLICNETVPGEVIVGFKVKDETDQPVLGTNTKIKNIVLNMEKGDRVALRWDIPVIFNDGIYKIDYRIEAANYASVYETWEDATRFEVFRNEQSSYSINPPIKTHVTRK